METLLQSTNLVRQAYWLVKLRWIAIGTLAAATFAASKVLNIPLPVKPLYIIAAVLVAYNYVIFSILRNFKSPPHKIIRWIITVQISMDIVILTAILHYSGGIENPFFLYFVFHMIITTILLTRLMSYLEAVLAVFLFSLLVILEAKGVISHYDLPWFAGYKLHQNTLFIFGTLWVFSTTLFLVVYMTNTICEELRRQQEGYERANYQLREKDRLKNEYVLRLTHDIRGHLAAIQSCLDIVDNGMVGPLNENQKDLVERAYERAGKCLNFIKMLLKLTKMKMDGQVEMEDFSLKNVFFDSLASVEKRALQKMISIDYEIDPGIDRIYGEPSLIEEAITNLLFNALNYTPEKGNVRLSAKIQDDMVLVEVCDTGIGVPPAEIDRIFEEFYRAANARQMEREGTGLGLSIVKQIVGRHGGKVWVRNNESAGATFSFTLPMTKRNQNSAATA